MKLAARVTGVDRLVVGLNKEIAKVEKRTLAGLFAAGLILQGEAQKRVPVELGNLRGSAFTRKQRRGDRKTGMVGEPSGVEVGFTASYAFYVHENLEQKLKGQSRPSGLGVYWGPAGEPKFLEVALVTSKNAMLAAIVSHAEIKP